MCTAHLNGIRRGVGYVVAGFVMLIGTASLFFTPCAVTTTITKTPIKVNDNGTDDRRKRIDDMDDFRFLSDDQRRNHRRKQENNDCENDVTNNIYFRSSPVSGNHMQRDSARTGNRPSPMSATRDRFHLLKFKSASTSMTARSGTWPTVAAIPSPMTEVIMRNTGYYDNQVGVSELQSPISAVDKVTDFLRRKCTVGGIRSTSAAPFWSRDSTGNECADRKDNDMRLFVGDRVWEIQIQLRSFALQAYCTLCQNIRESWQEHDIKLNDIMLIHLTNWKIKCFIHVSAIHSQRRV